MGIFGMSASGDLEEQRRQQHAEKALKVRGIVVPALKKLRLEVLKQGKLGSSSNNIWMISFRRSKKQFILKVRYEENKSLTEPGLKFTLEQWHPYNGLVHIRSSHIVINSNTTEADVFEILSEMVKISAH